MPESKHTQGPLRTQKVMEPLPAGIKELEVYSIDTVNTHDRCGMPMHTYVGYFKGMQDDEQNRANANLFAAASDMLEALEWVINWAEKEVPRVRLSKVEIVIAKAKGEA